MNLSGTQLKDTYGNLLTIGTSAGSPQTGTLQNGDGQDITSLTLAGDITASKNQNATSSFTFQNTDTTGTNVRTHLNAIAGNRSVRLEAIHSDYSYLVSNNARLYLQTNSGSNNPVYLDGDNVIFNGQLGIGVTSPSYALDVTGDIALSNDLYVSNGNFIKLQRNSGGLYLDVLGTPSGTDDVRLLTSGAFDIVNGSLTSMLKVDSSGNVGIGGSPSTFANYTNVSIKGGSSGSNLDFLNSSGTRVGAIVSNPSADLIIETNEATPLVFKTNDNPAMTIDSSGQVGIGNTDPQAKLDVEGGILSSAGLSALSASNIFIDQVTSDLSRIGVVGADTSTVGTLSISQYSSNGSVGRDVIKIDTSGNVGIGVSPQRNLHIDGGSISSDTPTVRISSTDSSGTNKFGIEFYSNSGADIRGKVLADNNGRVYIDDNGGGGVVLQANGGTGNVGIGTTSPDNKLVVADSNGAGLEIIPQTSNDRTTLLSYDRNASTYQTLDFDSSDVHFNISGSEKVRIDSSGNVGIGTTNPSALLSGGNVAVDVSSSNGGEFVARRSGGQANLAMGVTSGDIGYLYSTTATPMVFGTNNSERMRILSGGDVSFAMQDFSASPSNTVYGLRLITGAAGKSYWKSAVNADTTHYHYEFLNTNGSVGNISTSASATAYNTSSDYRLKENVVEMTGALDRVDQLKPSRFNFIADADTTVDGFLAHEVADVVPEAITGEKDAVDDEGNPIYQSIDQSKLVPLLVGAIQELRAEIEQLKNQ